MGVDLKKKYLVDKNIWQTYQDHPIDILLRFPVSQNYASKKQRPLILTPPPYSCGSDQLRGINFSKRLKTMGHVRGAVCVESAALTPNQFQENPKNVFL